MSRPLRDGETTGERRGSSCTAEELQTAAYLLALDHQGQQLNMETVTRPNMENQGRYLRVDYGHAAVGGDE